MSGIAGLRRQDLELLAPMLDNMGLRAGAQRSRWSPSPDIGLAAGAPEGRPPAPVYVSDGCAIVLDARLEDQDGAPLGNPGQAVVDVYKREGVAGFSRLRGDFALALWDQEQQRLVCARDVLGARPLFYRCAGTAFAFASEERGLGPLFGGEPIDERRIAEFLAGVAPPGDCGLRASVRRVLPGTAVIADGADVSVERFDRLILPPETSDGPAAQARRFRTLLQDAIRRRCRGEPLVHCFLSGGLDSSSIARLALAETSAPIRTLSLVHRSEPRLSEQRFIDAVLSNQGFDPVYHDVSGHDPFAGAATALKRHAGPVAAPNLLMMRPLYEAVQSGGVVFDGHGGDEVVSKGTGRLLDLARAGRWIMLLRELRGVADLYGEGAWRMLAALYGLYGPGRHKLSAIRRRIRGVDRRKAPAQDDPLVLLEPAFRQRSGIDGALAERRRVRPASGREAEHDVLLDPQQSYFLEVLDREAQDAGVESRFPFWDRALIEYSMSLPTKAKLHGGWTRFILRQALVEDLPAEILWRRDKHDFSRQLRDGLRRSPVVSREALEAGRTRLSPFLNVDGVLALRARLDDPQAGVSGRDLQMLWRVGLWSIWLEQGEEAARAAARSLKSEQDHVPH